MSAQLENGYIRIANEIWDEIIRRDFSKRQKDILMFIWRLSYGCNKKIAHIPLLQDFALCGISPTQITSELKYLMTCKVIEWDRSEMTFSFNKNYEIWQVNPVKKWDDERFKELIHANLSKKTSQNMNFMKHELHEKRSLDFMKSEVGQASKPWESKAEDVSKDSIKDIQEEERSMTALDAYYYSFKKVSYTGHIQGYIVELSQKGYTDAFFREVFLAMGAYGVGPDIHYMKKLCEDWMAKGIYTFAEAQRRREDEKKNVVAFKTNRTQNNTPPATNEFIPDPELAERVRIANGDV